MSDTLNKIIEIVTALKKWGPARNAVVHIDGPNLGVVSSAQVWKTTVTVHRDSQTATDAYALPTHLRNVERPSMEEALTAVLERLRADVFNESSALRNRADNLDALAGFPQPPKPAE